MQHASSFCLMSRALCWLLAAASGLGQDLKAEEPPVVTTDAAVIERIREEMAGSTDAVEKAVLAEQLRYHEARRAGNRDDMLQAIDNLQSIGSEHAEELFGAEALVRAAEYSSEIGQYAGARALFEKASQRYRANAHWPDSQTNAVDCGIRVGDMFRYEGDLPKAVETWKALFRQSSDVPLAAQLPEKIRLAQRQFMGPEEAWNTGVQFFEEAIERCGGAQWLDRFELERFWVLRDGLSVVVDGKAVSLISKEQLLKEVDAILAKYPPGKSRLIDFQRGTLLTMRENFLPKAGGSKARSDLRAITDMGVPDIALDKMARPDLELEEAADVSRDAADEQPAEAQRNEEAATGGRSWAIPATVAAILAAGAVVIWLLARARTSR